MEPQRLCTRYRRREIQYGTQEGTGFSEKYRSRYRGGDAGAISGGINLCDVRPRDKWTSARVDEIGFCWTRRDHIGLVGIPAELISQSSGPVRYQAVVLCRTRWDVVPRFRDQGAAGRWSAGGAGTLRP